MAISFVDDGAALRNTLFEALRSASDDVRQAIGDERLGGAVHEYRKGLRRARALLCLVTRELPKPDRRDIERALKEARRALGPARDQAVAHEVLAKLSGDDERALAKVVLDRAASTAQSTAEIRQLLAEGAARMAAQVELIDALLPPVIEWRAIVDGVRATYARARRARRAAKRSRHAFHSWRRRCKELAIQLDVLAQFVPHAAALYERVVAASDGLGTTVDLLMARDFVRQYSDDNGVELLARALERELDDRIREGGRAGRDAFRKKPRALARKLINAARCAATPVVAPPLMRDEEFAMT